MLASITPLGERGRQSTWGITVGAFLLAALGAGALAGAALGTVGSVALSAISPGVRLGSWPAARWSRSGWTRSR